MESPPIPTPSAVQMRAELYDLVYCELVGPHEPLEEIAENPQRRYVVGQLAPATNTGVEDFEADDDFAAEELASSFDDASVLEASPERIEGLEGDGDDGTEAAGEDSSTISKARRESLSSMGVSFVVLPGTEVEYHLSWGEYHRGPNKMYVRSPHVISDRLLLSGPSNLRSVNHGRVDVKWLCREVRGLLIASIFVVNVSDSDAKDGTERLYQVSIALDCGGSVTGFLSRGRLGMEATRPASMEDLLYRDRREFGVGLHTAVRPVIQSGVCRRLVSHALPSAESYNTASRPVDGALHSFDMSWLSSEIDASVTASALRSAFAGYVDWLNLLRRDVDHLDEVYRTVASVQIERIEKRIGRLLDGISILASDPAAFKAFRFANEAMARAQYRSSQKGKGDSSEPTDDGRKAGSWRPFQLAFLLSTLPEIVDPSRSERGLVDVLFFPTGGGKTEAYLGLSAFAMGYRRFARPVPEDGAGISTLMRYTLRLLTTQQFTRAATMICAAETIRRGRLYDGLGDVPFSIGLWVGPMTPSTFSGAKEALLAARAEHFSCPRSCSLSGQFAKTVGNVNARREDSTNVLPITECPWCFSILCIECVDLDTDAERLIVRCPNVRCAFAGDTTYGTSPKLRGLPIAFVDSDVYKMCPSVLIATVDKFATLPFKGEAKAIFGRVSSRCSICGYLTECIDHKKGHRELTETVSELVPADLVIQDELHTITDNLGSIYGLYETAIEYLLSRDEVRPKYVCATATIKDVDAQIRSLYGGRSASVFPPTGLEVGTSRPENPRYQLTRISGATS